MCGKTKGICGGRGRLVGEARREYKVHTPRGENTGKTSRKKKPNTEKMSSDKCKDKNEKKERRGIQRDLNL